MKNNIILLSALIILLPGVVKSQVNRSYDLIMRSNFGTTTLWDNNVVRIYGFSKTLSSLPMFPGPTLYVEEGDSLFVNAANISQTHNHTVHLHGMDANTKNDGDPMTSHPVFHGQTKTYKVLAKHAGTYLYHCHVEDIVHVQLGMYGLVVVKAAGGAKTAWTGGPPFNKSYNWLMSELDKSWHDNIPEMKDDTLKIPPYIPKYFLVNGKSEQQIDSDDSIRIAGSQNEFIYMRLANIGNFTNRIVFPSTLNAVIIDSDGRPLPNSINNDTVMIMPGERYGVMLNPQAQFTDSVSVSYINMNTDSVWNTQQVPVNISGFFAVNDLADENMISIYPNPVRMDSYGAISQINIRYQGKEKTSNVDVSIINSLGQLVMQESKQSTNNSFSLDVSGLSNGLYFIKLNINGNYLNKKLLISK
jgi:FtsP/CotA-like multicopper oxidase with cupredoxin domain